MLHRVSTRLWMSAGLAASLALGGSASADFIYTLNNTPGLISHWSLNETTGNTVLDSVTTDAIDGANNGTISGTGVSLNASGPRPTDTVGGDALIGFSPNNRSVNFTGDDSQRLLMNPAGYTGPGGLVEATLAMWFRITDTNDRHHHLGGLESSTLDASGRYALVLNHYNDDNGLRAFSRFSNGGPEVEAATTNDQTDILRDSIWHFAVATVSKSGTSKNINLYVDGELVQTRSAANAANYPLALRDTLSFGYDVGTNALSNGGARAMVGQLDEIAFFNRALTSSEVSALYASAFQPLQIPEPSTICMVLAAATGALVWRRQMA